jgi:hypothetical protein|tara:strand:+ start:345 stop:488 length:144 start_codon:yes stop_codon:yes gene_type:complete
MKFKYIGKRPFWDGEKKFVNGDISDEKHSNKFIKVAVKKQKIVKEEK